MSRKPLHLVQQPQQIPSACTQQVGWFVGWSNRDEALVDYTSNTAGPLVARSTVALPERDATCTLDNAPAVLLVIDDADPTHPIVVGLIEAPKRPAKTLEGPRLPGVLELSVDGRRVSLEAKDEIVLACGKASITLRRNGRLIIQGTYVETSSEGVNRITGGSVEIN